MAAQKAEGIILKKYFLRETSYILVVFTKEFGKVQGTIKGVRAPYPQFAGNFEIFAKCELLIYKKNKRPLDLITQCQLLDFFLPARKDIERLTYANYFIELVNIVAADYDANVALYEALSKSLSNLREGLSARRTSRIFELKFLQALGLSPEMSVCVNCAAPVKDNVFFRASSGGVICAACGGGRPQDEPASRGTVNFIKKIQETDIDKTRHIKVSRDVGEQTEKVLKKFLKYHIDRPIKSLEFLEDLEKIHLPCRPRVPSKGGQAWE